jgi:hypothetical protein
VQPTFAVIAQTEYREGDMFFELRQYTIRPGKMDEFILLMEDEIIPFQVAQGMVINGMFRGEQDETKYVWIRRFDSESERDELYKKVYQSDFWKNTIGPRVPDMVEKTDVTRLVPTKHSVMQ